MTYFSDQSIPSNNCTRSVTFRTRCKTAPQLAHRPQVLHTTSKSPNSKSACCPPSPLNRAVRRSAVALPDASSLIREHGSQPEYSSYSLRLQRRINVNIAAGNLCILHPRHESRLSTRRGCSFHAHPPHPARLWLSLQSALPTSARVSMHPIPHIRIYPSAQSLSATL